ncbi:MAG: hypothetical protein JWQ29_253 [Phenylobacterium sp.]|nr:hypothetical protein [Phenylobacterium sp.]
MRPVHAFRKSLAILGAAFATAVLLSLLPEHPYQRWQLLEGTIHARSRWIYERINFDPQPLDVVFIGPSRVGAAVDAPRLGQALAARGLPSNVVNFALPEAGRNINDVIVREMLAKKQPKLIVIGVTEKPSRFGHSAFKFIAPRGMVAWPGYVSDANYLADLIYLPYRQAELFAAYVAPGVLGPSNTFDPARYRGHAIDTTGDIRLPDGTIKNGRLPADMTELERGVRKLERGTHPPILSRRYADLEFGDERHYVREICDLAHARGIRVAFLFLPYYTGASDVQEEPLYRSCGPVWNAGFLSPHAELYSDYAHLTSAGADQLTDWLVAPVSQSLQAKGPPP